ncbi:MAG: hypothetical protein Q9185_000822 [Variospora sp. 1 TL-2023]
MARVFNIGVGMAIVVAQEDVEAVTKMLKDGGEKVTRIGRLVGRAEGDEDMQIRGPPTTIHRIQSLVTEVSSLAER